MPEIKKTPQDVKKCPCCNGEAYIVCGHCFLYIQCGLCGLRTKDYWFEIDAIKDWNARVNESPCEKIALYDVG